MSNTRLEFIIPTAVRELIRFDGRGEWLKFEERRKKLYCCVPENRTADAVGLTMSGTI